MPHKQLLLLSLAILHLNCVGETTLPNEGDDSSIAATSWKATTEGAPSCGEAGGNTCAQAGDPICNGHPTLPSHDCNPCCFRAPPPIPVACVSIPLCDGSLSNVGTEGQEFCGANFENWRCTASGWQGLQTSCN